MTSKIHGTRRDTASVSTTTRTTHYVSVDLSDLLAQFDVTDDVILMVATPSGRDQRVAVRRNLLAPARNDEGWAV